MEYRKMVLMNLSAEQEWKHRKCEQTLGMASGGGRKGMDRVTWKHTLPYVK